MAEKKQAPAPIDRPLSRAFLRQFIGWSTEFPPGASEPNSLRTMEDALVSRDGALCIRPGMKSWTTPRSSWTFWGEEMSFVSSLEPFYLNSGELAYLAALKDETSGYTTLATLRKNVTGLYHPEPLFNVFTPKDQRFNAAAYGGAGVEYVRFVQIDNKVVALWNSTDPTVTPTILDVGTAKTYSRPAEVTAMAGNWWEGESFVTATLASTDFRQGHDLTEWTGIWTGFTTETLISSEASANTYSFGYFATFSNEFGESPPTPMRIVKTQRPHGMWKMTTVDDQPASDPDLAVDRIVVYLADLAAPYAWVEAYNQTATTMNVYCAEWSDEGVVPADGILIGTVPVANTVNVGTGFRYSPTMYVLHTPAMPSSSRSYPVPARTNAIERRDNSTKPGRPTQALVAGDRIIYTNDRARPGVIRWSGNLQGEYLNTAPSMGGGFKTLSSGNMQIPAVAKLWQNPQSTDTITILNYGTDGYSTSYYMAPAEITSQSESVSIMGFEETSATPGTTSTYGVEVFNNALYHPLEDQLMKSTANNYNINHKNLTENIRNRWQALQDRDKIVSCEHDGRLYYIVNNPKSYQAVPEGCNGNEIWVYDAMSEAGTWSRYLIPAVSLRRILFDGVMHMAVIRPEGAFVLDEYYDRDDHTGEAIPWRIETNIQGANRAHDAWAHLKQVAPIFGNLEGKIRYGIRGLDLHGRPVNVWKVYESPVRGNGLSWSSTDLHMRPDPYDHEDYLDVSRDMKEWFFYAEAYRDVEDTVSRSRGQITAVSYRYTPVSVNVGTTFGSVETFEYGNSNNSWYSRGTNSGVPIPNSAMIQSTEPAWMAPPQP